MNWQHLILTVEYGALARWALGAYLIVTLIGIRGGMVLERHFRQRKTTREIAVSTDGRPN